jgi:hypothetical protein
MTQQDCILHGKLEKLHSIRKEEVHEDDSTNQQDVEVIKTPPSHGPLKQDSYSNKEKKSYRKNYKEEIKDKLESTSKLEPKIQQNASQPYEDLAQSEQRKKRIIKERFEEFKKIKHKFAPAAEIEPTVQVIDPNVNNIGIYALVKLDPLTRYELN